MQASFRCTVSDRMFVLIQINSKVRVKALSEFANGWVG